MRGTHKIGDYRGDRSFPVEMIAEFGDEHLTVVERTSVEAPDALNDTRAVTVPVAALAEIVPYAERRLGLSGTGTDLADRYLACLTALAGRSGREVSAITHLHNDKLGQVADWYTELGLAHQETDRHTGRTRRVVLLRVRPEPGDYNRTLYLEVATGDPRQPDRLQFHESYQRSGDNAHLHTVQVPFERWDRLVAVPEARLNRLPGDDPEDRLVAAFTALVAGGHLGAHLPYRENRDRVHRWYAEAGMTCRRSGPILSHDLVPLANLPGGGSLSLSVGTSTVDDTPSIEFRQLLFGRHPESGTQTSTVRTPLSSLGAVVASLERRLGRQAGPPTEDQLFACLTALVERGELGTARGVQNAELVAGMLAEAGAPYVFSGARSHLLLAAYRKETGCHIALQLTVDLQISGGGQLAGLLFTERHDYSPRPGDAGREYGYSAEMAPAPVERLIGRLERRLRLSAASSDPQERLVACFKALVDRGELSGDLPPKENRNRVAAVLRRLGKVTTDSSVWVNSD